MIVLDVNSFPAVFDQNCSDNADFCHVLDWVIKQKNACFVYGGSKYKFELGKMVKYLKIANEFKKIGKFVEINTQLIDVNANQLKKICPDVAFDDEHIVAILNVSGCKLVCTRDVVSMPYIKCKDFYFDHKIPKIYSSVKNKNLLNVNFIMELKNRC
jgi:hypothetical protein